MRKKPKRKSIPAIKVRQWLKDWDQIHWNPDEKRSKPPAWFYQFSIKASELKALSGIYPRTTKRSRSSQDLGIQRAHEVKRSEEISEFIKFGYPWSSLSEPRRRSDEFSDLRQPGWLPTALVINILTSNDERNGKRISNTDLVEIRDSGNSMAELLLPENFKEKNWRSKSIQPIEVIDGQHRLWAFEETDLKGDYELPVVAFVGLDLSWQAYLFYTINIKPKKINPSLAFDLYPLLRTEKWLAKFEGHVIYRETRAQELVDMLWWYLESPWYHRINMLGESGRKGIMVTQASWVRSLLASFIKSWDSSRTSIGGLYGSFVGHHKTVLPWSLEEQAAFLIVAGQLLREAVGESQEPWAKKLRGKIRQKKLFGESKDPAFFGRHNLLNQDQGIRILLQVVNDLCFVKADRLNLHNWGGSQTGEETPEKRIDDSIQSLKKQTRIVKYLMALSESLASYDWRASSAPGLTEEQRTLKASFRGSGGYRELRRSVLKHISKGKNPPAEEATKVLRNLGY